MLLREKKKYYSSIINFYEIYFLCSCNVNSHNGKTVVIDKIMAEKAIAAAKEILLRTKVVHPTRTIFVHRNF